MRIPQNWQRMLAVTSLIFGLTACSTTATHEEPQPVVIIYRAKPGSEAALQDTIKRAWQIYRREHLVCDEPHICMEIPENSGKNRFIEMFSWVGPFAVEHPSENVRQVWKQMESLCENSNDGSGLEIYDSGSAKLVNF